MLRCARVGDLRKSPHRLFSKYLAEGLPKQDVDTLRDIREYVNALIKHREQPVEAGELPDTAEPVDRNDSGKGTVVKEKVKCGDETCKCASGNPADMHGPYLYRYYREGGELTSEYLGKP
jgi:hypothetical protein